MRSVSSSSLEAAILTACEDLFKYDTLKDDAGLIAGCHNAEHLAAQNLHHLHEGTTELVCGTCANAISHGKVPRMLKLRILYPIREAPEFLATLDEAEERCVALRTPFMQIKQLRIQGQKQLKGSILNVPNSLDRITPLLPRSDIGLHIIELHLKRQLHTDHAYLRQMVEPHKIWQALQYLLPMPLYQQYSASMDPAQWQQLLEAVKPICATNDEVADMELGSDTAPVTDSLIENHLTSAVLHNEAISLAPAENNQPLYILRDQHAEELSYPKLFLGRARPKVAPGITYSKIVRYELRHSQRRFAACISNCFFKFRKLQYLKVNRSKMINVRKGQFQQEITAADAMDDDWVAQRECRDECYHFLEDIQSSPDYKHKLKLDLYAMLRQLGPPTWFLTCTANDLNWSELIQALAWLADGVKLTAKEACSLSSAKKAELIRNDPVTCARMYKRRMAKLLRLLLANADLIGEVVDFGGADETQGRGTFHSHLQVFLRRMASLDDPAAILAELQKLCDLFISCDTTILPVHLQTVQQHTCRERSSKTTRACLYKHDGEMVCHFGFPKPPMDEHTILCPFSADEKEQFSRYKPLYSAIKQRLRHEEGGRFANLTELLEDLRITRCEYLQAVRTSIDRDHFFFKRTPGQAWTNAFPSKLLPVWNAHMDMQIVLDAYASGAYIASYIMKGQRGMSNMLRAVVEECKEQGSNLRTQINRVGSAFMNAQELPFKKQSHTCWVLVRKCSHVVWFLCQLRLSAQDA